MSNPASAPAPGLDDHAARLIHGYFERTLTDAEHAALAAMIRTIPAAAAAFARWSMTTSHLLEAPVAEGVGSIKPDLSPPHARHTPTLRPPKRLVLAAAAILLLAAAAVAIYLAAINSKPEIRNPKPTPSAPVATLIDFAGGGTVMYEDDIARSGVEYGSGSYSLDAGSAQFMLASRVSVDLRGRTLLVMRDAMHATLEHGSAAFRCPPQAKGFTVRLPGGTSIVDLGTAFKVDIDDAGPTRIAVTEGSVVVTAPGRAALHVIAGQSALVRHDAAGAVASVELIDRPDAAIEDLIRDPALIAWHDFEADGDAEGYFPGSRSRSFNADSAGVPVAAGGPYEAMTMAMWVYLDEPTASAALVMSDGWGGDGATHWQLDRGRPMLITYRGPGVRVTESISLKRWTHVAVVVDLASESAIYIDGRLAAAESAAQADRRPLRPGDMHIGVWNRLAFAQQQNPRVLLGRADDAGLWSRALTADEIARLAARPDPDRSDNGASTQSHDAADRE